MSARSAIEDEIRRLDTFIESIDATLADNERQREDLRRNDADLSAGRAETVAARDECRRLLAVIALADPSHDAPPGG